MLPSNSVCPRIRELPVDLRPRERLLSQYGGLAGLAQANLDELV